MLELNMEEREGPVPSQVSRCWVDEGVQSTSDSMGAPETHNSLPVDLYGDSSVLTLELKLLSCCEFLTWHWVIAPSSHADTGNCVALAV